MDELTHVISITITGRYPHGREHEQAHVRMAGTCDTDHFIEVFKAAMVAAGFSTQTAAKLDEVEF